MSNEWSKKGIDAENSLVLYLYLWRAKKRTHKWKSNQHLVATTTNKYPSETKRNNDDDDKM